MRAASSGVAPRWICSMSARTRATSIEAFSATRPRPAPGAIDARRPNQNFRVIRPDSERPLHELPCRQRHPAPAHDPGLQVTAHYTWSRTRDVGTNSNGGSSQNPGVDPFTPDRRPTTGLPIGMYRTGSWPATSTMCPFFKDSGNPFLKYVLSGWQVGGITTLESGRPFGLTIHRRPGQYGDRQPAAEILVGAIPSSSCQDNPAGPGKINCIDPAAFALPAQFTYGNAPRNLLRGPGDILTDLSLLKNFPDRRASALPDPCRRVQCLQPRELRQPEWGVRHGEFRQNHVGRRHAPRGAGWEDSVLARRSLRPASMLGSSPR